MKVEERLEMYEKNLLVKSEGTRKQYLNDLKVWFRYMKNKKRQITKDEDFVNIDYREIKKFINYLIKNGRAATTIRRKIISLKLFFQYLDQEKIVLDNPFDKIDKRDLPKIPKRLPKSLSIEECKRLINSVNSRNTIRDKCIIIIFLSTGMRLSELISLNVDNILEEEIRIIGKENKERVVYLTDQAKKIVKLYIKQRPKNLKTKALFLSERNGRIARGTVQNAIRNAMYNAGIKGDNDVLVHILRHTFATLLYQSGEVDLFQLQELLGHEDVSTTRIYTDVSKEQLKNAVEANPLNKIF